MGLRGGGGVQSVGGVQSAGVSVLRSLTAVGKKINEKKRKVALFELELGKAGRLKG